ncbi:MAG: serine protein kinase PrkA [Myxococcales bacterium]|nr:serine protein kinase PrkA [Myxococcales bacterium]MCB9650740.1 serine protein kinase PrkA [Deltaproteobacteria bacterium]
MAERAEPGTVLGALSGRVKQAFEENRSLMSYAAWFEQLWQNPAQHLRSSSQYIRDVFEHFGTEELDLPRGKVRRFKLFDAPWAANGDGRVAGQEQVQNEIYRLLSNFARDGKVSRLILLHGPNGSAKSSIIGCIQGGMEAYSNTPAGALYSYAWIFPSERVEKGRLGFGAAQGGRTGTDSYAHLDADQVDARLPCELRDHPLFLIPKAERKQVLEQLVAEGKLPADFVLSRYILEGDLSPRDRAIYDALLMAYEGDHTQVLRHVQVERFYISMKYGNSVATVEPQMHVDADARQLTADRSIANLPRSLQTVPLFEIGGPLIAANRGMLEFSDLLKRPVEAFKYLLTTSEEGQVSLPQFTVYLDEVLIASSNEKHLAAFKEHPDWSSFKGRTELVRVPYLLRYKEEVQIYASQIRPASVPRPMAPHTIEVAAYWAVLTRLKCPDPAHFEEPVAAILQQLTPMEKLRLYDTGEAPSWVGAREARELVRQIPTIWNEYRNVPYYEGFLGASAREIRTALLNAAGREGFRCLSPLPVLAELEEVVRDPSLYPYLAQEPKSGFHENKKFITIVRDQWLDVLDDEIRTSMGLVEEARYEELFARYVSHVSHSLKKEKLLDKITGGYVDPDQEMMKEVESHILAKGEERLDFRRAIIARIGAWGLDHPNETPRYRQLFKSYIEKMEADYYVQQKRVIAKNLETTLLLLADEPPPIADEDLKQRAQATIENMERRFGYPRVAIAECAGFLMKQRYRELQP